MFPGNNTQTPIILGGRQKDHIFWPCFEQLDAQHKKLLLCLCSFLQQGWGTTTECTVEFWSTGISIAGIPLFVMILH